MQRNVTFAQSRMMAAYWADKNDQTAAPVIAAFGTLPVARPRGAFTIPPHPRARTAYFAEAA